MKFKMNYNNYSPGALNQVIEQAPGKPFKNVDDEVIGIIKSAELHIENGFNLIEFEVGMIDMYTKNLKLEERN